MGQRANYILIEAGSQTIYYHHWRATHIESDLYLGEKRFIDFVRSCQTYTKIMEEVWIEGCVIIDLTKRELFFWTTHMDSDTSLINYYLNALQTKWAGWKVEQCKNRMYDVEKILSIDYVSKQKKPELSAFSTEWIIDDKVEEWDSAIIIIKNGTDLFATKTGNLNTEGTITYGAGIIDLLLNKPPCEIPLEGKAPWDCVVIDIQNKQIYIHRSIFGLWEESSHKWPGFAFTMGDYGYLGTLQLAGIDTRQLPMPAEEIEELFAHMIIQRETYDPSGLANKLLQENKDIQFNPRFFDHSSPKRTMLEKLKKRLQKLLWQKGGPK